MPRQARIDAPEALHHIICRGVNRVAKLFKMRPREILNSGKQPERVRARSQLCYWAVKELGMNGTAVARLLGIIQSSVSRAVRRRERLAIDSGYSMEGEGNAQNHGRPLLLNGRWFLCT